MSLFDLSWAVNAFATHDVTVKRFGAPTFTLGVAGDKPFTTSTTRGSVQPISGEKLARLPEAFIGSVVVSVWALTQLITGDEVVIDGQRYQIEIVEDWNANGNYTKAVARQLDEREAA